MNSVVKRLPDWLKREMPQGGVFHRVKDLLKDESLNTVCKSANCPNRWECYSRGTATFLLMGEICTRNCGFCAVEKGEPAPVDRDEPRRVAGSVKKLALKHAVITSVTRDDIVDGGAAHFKKTILEIRRVSPSTTIEVLTPDFLGEEEFIKIVLEAKPDVFAHNIEMAPRLYSAIRDRSSYERSLSVLRIARSLDEKIFVKSGIMAGLGETDEEIIGAMRDLAGCGVDIMTIGQYLQPKKNCVKPANFVAPEKFKYYYLSAKRLGFKFVYSGPFVRSSYRAEEVFS